MHLCNMYLIMIVNYVYTFASTFEMGGMYGYLLLAPCVMKRENQEHGKLFPDIT